MTLAPISLALSRCFFRVSRSHLGLSQCKSDIKTIFSFALSNDIAWLLRWYSIISILGVFQVPEDIKKIVLLNKFTKNLNKQNFLSQDVRGIVIS